MKKINSFHLLVFLLLVLAFGVSAKDSPKVEDFKLVSRLMTREMPYRVIFPPKYKQKDEKTRYPVIYLLHGLTGHFNNWTDKTKVVEYAAKYRFIIVMPEGEDGWYSDSISAPNDKHESYFIQELIPEIDSKFRTIAGREGRIITGLSMGGYGSLKFGIKYPDKFALSGSFSGALEAPINGQNNSFLRPSVLSVFGQTEKNSHRLANDIYTLIKEFPENKLKELPSFYIDCGTEDIFIGANQSFANLLLQKKVPHEYRHLPGKHDWKFWDARIDEFLELAQKFINKKVLS